MDRLSELMSSPAYFDASHPQHKAAAAEAKAIFEAQATGAGDAEPNFTGLVDQNTREQRGLDLSTPEHRRMYQLMQGPAYFNEKHPEHLLVKREVARLADGFSLQELKEG